MRLLCTGLVTGPLSVSGQKEGSAHKQSEHTQQVIDLAGADSPAEIKPKWRVGCPRLLWRGWWTYVLDCEARWLIIIIISWRDRQTNITVNNQAQVMLRLKGWKNLFRGTKRGEAVRTKYKRKMNFYSDPGSRWMAPSKRTLQRSGFSLVSCQLLIKWCFSCCSFCFSEDFLFAIWILQAVSGLMVSFQVR